MGSKVNQPPIVGRHRHTEKDESLKKIPRRQRKQQMAQPTNHQQTKQRQNDTIRYTCTLSEQNKVHTGAALHSPPLILGHPIGQDNAANLLAATKKAQLCRRVHIHLSPKACSCPSAISCSIHRTRQNPVRCPPETANDRRRSRQRPRTQVPEKSEYKPIGTAVAFVSPQSAGMSPVLANPIGYMVDKI